MINPKEIASDTQLEDESKNPKEPEDEKKKLEMDLLLEDNEASIPKESISTPKVTFEVSIFTNVSSLFPSRFAKFKEEEHTQDILETLKNLFVDVIQQVLKDA